MTKQADIECYINLYKSVHGTKPKSLDLQSWSSKELQEGIRALSLMEKNDA